MSVYFRADVRIENVESLEEPCLCAQMSPVFYKAMKKVADCMRPELKDAANPACPVCKGTGVEVVQKSDAPFMNLANENARLFLSVMGIKQGLVGSLTIAEARRHLIRAKARKDLTAYTRLPYTKYRDPLVTEDGVWVLHPVRVFDEGCSESRLRKYIARFERLVNDSTERGATRITWN